MLPCSQSMQGQCQKPPVPTGPDMSPGQGALAPGAARAPGAAGSRRDSRGHSGCRQRARHGCFWLLLWEAMPKGRQESCKCTTPSIALVGLFLTTAPCFFWLQLRLKLVFSLLVLFKCLLSQFAEQLLLYRS